jgi:uncharacterized protein YhfF
MTKAAILAKYPGASRWAFGDSPMLADELLQRVLEGQKNRHLLFLSCISARARADARGLQRRA